MATSDSLCIALDGSDREWIESTAEIRVPARIDIGRNLDCDGHIIASWSGGKRTIPLLVVKDKEPVATDALRIMLDDLFHERYLTPWRPKLSFLPFNATQWIPGAFRAPLKRRVSRTAIPVGKFPAFPIEPAGELLRHLASLGHRPSGEKREAPILCVSHDVDSAQGLRLAVHMAGVEKDLNVPSTYFVVGVLLRRYPVAAGRLRELGRDLGLHGVRHDTWLPFQTESRIHRELARYQSEIRRFDLRGYRSPMLLRSRNLHQCHLWWLARWLFPGCQR